MFYAINEAFIVRGKQLLWTTTYTIMVQGIYGPVPSCYGPLQLWSSTHMGHMLNELGLDIGLRIGLGIGIGLGLGIGLRVGSWVRGRDRVRCRDWVGGRGLVRGRLG